MPPSFPFTPLANLLTLPAREFVVLDVGDQRARLLRASLSRGRPRLLGTDTVDAHEDALTTPAELREEIRCRLRDTPHEAVILLLPQHQVLRHVLDVPPGTPTETRARVEREADSMGGLSDSPWLFDAVRLHPFGGPSHPLAAVLCRQDALDLLLDSFVDNRQLIFDVRCGGDALAAAFLASRPHLPNAILVDLGARHTTLVILVDGQTVFSGSFPSGSAAFTEAIASDRAASPETAELLKRAAPPHPRDPNHPRYEAAIASWLAELDRTVLEWQADHPHLSAIPSADVFLSGGGALQPGLAEELSAFGKRRFLVWPPPPNHPHLPPDFAAAWGALLLALGLQGPAPSLLPPPVRSDWNRQRLWRTLISINLAVAAMLAVALGVATSHQSRQLTEKAAWQHLASEALHQAADIRTLAESFNLQLAAFRPVLERQRHTMETLQVLRVLQQQHTNDNHWYVLLADASSYDRGSNSFAPTSPAPRPGDPRFPAPASPTSTNPPPSSRTFVAEICLVPQGESMRRTLSDLVGELKRSPVFLNVDVLPAEQWRPLVDTNLFFPDRHFALSLNLAPNELLTDIPLPRLNPTNREPRTPFRLPSRSDSPTNPPTRNGKSR